MQSTLPTLDVSREEKFAGRIDERSLETAAPLFIANGVLAIRGALASELVDELHAAFLARQQRFLINTNHDNALTVGDRRFQVTIELEPPFDDPLIFANPFVVPLLERLLGADLILSSFGAVVSLEAAPEQHVHRDFPGLFPKEGLDGFLPAFAITVIVPLIDIDEVTGTTLVWPGTHRMDTAGAHEHTPPTRPLLSRGDCLLMDYRIVHGGSANRSNRPRPVLYSVYSRPWFRDHKNFSKQKMIAISRDRLARVPREHRHLFAHVASTETEIGFEK